MTGRPGPAGASLEDLSTELTTLGEDELTVGGRPAAEIIESFGFERMVALVLGLELSDPELSVLRACLVVNPDHGLVSNATTAAIAATSTSRAGVAHGVAAGLLAIGPVTISPGAAMEYLVEAAADERGVDEVAGELVAAAARRGERILGFGSPVHPNGDPRVAPLREALVEAGCWRRHCALLQALGEALAASGRPLPVNEVGLMAAGLADLGLSPDQGEAVAVIGTVPSLAANVLAELSSKPRFVVAQTLFGKPPTKEVQSR